MLFAVGRAFSKPEIDFSNVKVGSESTATTDLLNLNSAASKVSFSTKAKKVTIPASAARNNKSNHDLSLISDNIKNENTRQFVKTLDPRNKNILNYKHISRFDSGSSENSVNAVPAPGSIVLTAIGLSVVGWFRKRNALK